MGCFSFMPCSFQLCSSFHASSLLPLLVCVCVWVCCLFVCVLLQACVCMIWIYSMSPAWTVFSCGGKIFFGVFMLVHDLCLHIAVLCAYAFISVYSQVVQSISHERVFMSLQWIISTHTRECWDFSLSFSACPAFLLPHYFTLPSLTSSLCLLFPFLSPTLCLFFLSVTLSSSLLILWIIPIFMVHRD